MERILIPNYEDQNQVRPGTVEFGQGTCKGCTLCIDACPANSLMLHEEKACLKSGSENRCIACGDCVAICPDNLIRITSGYQLTKCFKTIDQGALTAPRLFAKEEEV